MRHKFKGYIKLACSLFNTLEKALLYFDVWPLKVISPVNFYYSQYCQSIYHIFSRQRDKMLFIYVVVLTLKKYEFSSCFLVQKSRYPSKGEVLGLIYYININTLVLCLQQLQNLYVNLVSYVYSFQKYACYKLYFHLSLITKFLSFGPISRHFGPQK